MATPSPTDATKEAGLEVGVSRSAGADSGRSIIAEVSARKRDLDPGKLSILWTLRHL